MTYNLNPLELLLVQSVAEQRQRAAEVYRRAPAHGYVEKSLCKSLAMNVIGATAEYVVSLVTGLPWHDYLEDVANSKDVGDDIQVRSTSYRYGKLIVHSSDPPEDRFVFAIVQGERVELVGWTYGRDAMKAIYWSDPTGHRTPAFFVPQSQLRPISEFLQNTPAGATKSF